MTLQRITENVYTETGTHGCNHSFVTTAEGVVMIDTPHKPSDAALWGKVIAAKGEVRYVILTEAHGDHSTTAYLFGGTLVSHRRTRDALEGRMLGTPTTDLCRRWAESIDPDGAHLLAGFHLRLPAITFDARLTIHLGDHTLELIHLPGHTPGQTGVFVPEEKVILTGDNVVYKLQTWLHDACPGEWLSSLKRIAALDVDAIVPGHGEVCDKGYLPEQAAFVREWIDAVRAAIAGGLSVEQAQATISFLDRYPMDAGLEDMGPVAQCLNVARLYSVLGPQQRRTLRLKPGLRDVQTAYSLRRVFPAPHVSSRD